MLLRWNERKLAELSQQEADPAFQRRSGRLENWMKLAKQSALQQNFPAQMPDRIEPLAPDIHLF